jgi:hypothetical protein
MMLKSTTNGEKGDRVSLDPYQIVGFQEHGLTTTVYTVGGHTFEVEEPYDKIVARHEAIMKAGLEVCDDIYPPNPLDALNIKL